MSDEAEPISPTPKPSTELDGLDPGELLARGLDTVKASVNASPWEPPTPEELARLLPQYHIESLLGRGGMGAVYKGVQVALDRPVAIKLLPAEVAADPQFIGRFQREARTLAKLQHPGIVAVYDFGQTSEGHLYFVMEYVDGTDLQRVLKGPGLNPEQAFELIAQVCDALHYAHRQGVIHRDIKPANILLTKDGRAKVADFGLARPIIEDGGGLTVTNMVMGTPDYMAPEQRTGATHADHRADIFALGVMLYEMLTGQRPHGAFQPPSKRVQVDVRIDEVVLKALQQEPDRRYQQASEMKTDVDRIRTTPPEKAKPKRALLFPLGWLGVAAGLVVIAWLGVRHFSATEPGAAADHPGPAPSATAGGPSTPAPAGKPADAKTIGEAKKTLADARAQAKAGDAAEARKLVQQALDAAGADLGVSGEAALVLAETQEPEHAAKLAADFAKAAEAEHPLFAPVAELRARLAPKLKQYAAHLAAAAKFLAAHDDEGEQRELQAALEILPDGHAANERAPQNPLIANKPIRGRKFTNSLGQKFVPLPSQPHLLFCIWEARVKDFEAFVQETGYQINVKQLSPPPGSAVTEPPYSWRNPGFPQTGDHPVVGVGREDAWAFCQWLTQKARAAGQLEAGQVYRLPTDREWSAAMGVTGEAGDFPEFRKFPDGVWSWGKTWPPPPNAENFAGDERKEFGGHGPKDDWVWTAPVGSGKPNAFGIYDLCGNVRELCKDHSSIRGGSFTVRGVDYAFTPNNNMGSALRSLGGFGATVGFRCIIDLQTPDRLPLAQKMEAAIDAYLARLPKLAIAKRYLIDYTVNEETVGLELPGNLGGRNSPTDDDLMVFADLPIERLYLPGAYTPNFTALHKMPLKVLWLEPADCTSFDGLKGLPLEWFEAAATGKCSVSDLEPLRGMKLKGLILGNDRFKAITDLSPLQGQPLQILDVSGTSVTDLSPVKAAPLEVLIARVNAIADPACVAWWPKLRDIGSWGPGGGFAGRLYAPVRDAVAKGDDQLALLHLDVLETTYGEAPWFNTYRSNADGLRAAAIQHELNRWLGGDRTGFKEQLKVFQGHAYLLVRASYNFDNAKEMAEMLGGHLVTITSKEENEFIKEEILKKYSDSHLDVWLGLTGVPNKEEWKWVTGEPFGFQAWDRFNGATSGVASRGDQNNNANWHYDSNSGAASGWVWWHGGAQGGHSFIIEWETANPALGAAP